MRKTLNNIEEFKGEMARKDAELELKLFILEEFEALGIAVTVISTSRQSNDTRPFIKINAENNDRTVLPKLLSHFEFLDELTCFKAYAPKNAAPFVFDAREADLERCKFDNIRHTLILDFKNMYIWLDFSADYHNMELKSKGIKDNWSGEILSYAQYADANIKFPAETTQKKYAGSLVYYFARKFTNDEIVDLVSPLYKEE